MLKRWLALAALVIVFDQISSCGSSIISSTARACACSVCSTWCWRTTPAAFSFLHDAGVSSAGCSPASPSSPRCGSRCAAQACGGDDVRAGAEPDSRGALGNLIDRIAMVMWWTFWLFIGRTLFPPSILPTRRSPWCALLILDSLRPRECPKGDSICMIFRDIIIPRKSI